MPAAGLTPPDVITVSEAADLLRVSRASLYRRLESGELPANVAGKFGGQWRLRRTALLDHVFAAA
jgi:excisionase family DNA binding protein